MSNDIKYDNSDFENSKENCIQEWKNNGASTEDAEQLFDIMSSFIKTT